MAQARFQIGVRRQTSTRPHISPEAPGSGDRLIANFLLPPGGALDLCADLLRVVGVFSILVAALWHDVTDAGILAFALPAIFPPRFLGLRASADIACSITVLMAAWSNVFDLYTTIS